MRLEWLGFEFGMELAAQEPWMVGRFDDFNVIFVGSAAGDAEARAEQSFFVIAIEFVAMAVTLADFGLAVGFMCEGTWLQLAGPRAKAHGAAHFIDTQ